jgi:cytoskeletal protein RodZ
MFDDLGERLRGYRLDSGMQIEDLAARTRITSQNILALEEGRLDLLPGEAFARGFIKAICAELGKEPEPLLEMFETGLRELSDRENEGPVETKKPFPLYISIGVLLVLIVGAILLHGGGKEESEIPVARETPVTDGNSVISTQSATVASTVEEAPVELNLVIRAIEKTWLRIQADNSKPWETTMKTGDEIRLNAMDQIRLLIGNAGGVLFELNGKRFGPPGSQGQVISDYVITRDNL